MNGRWALIAAAMLSARIAAAQNVPSPAQRAPDADIADHGRLPFRVFTDRDGLPQNSILKMALDHKGYLWVGTLDGAARYDGRRWTVVNMPDRTVSNQVSALLGTSDGSVWFGTDGAGLARLKDGQWTRYEADTGLAGRRIRALAESVTAGGTVLWVGTADRGLARFEDGRFSAVDMGQALSDASISSLLWTRGAEGPVLWVGSAAGGLARLLAGRWEARPLPEELARQTVLSLLETKEESGSPVLWVGTSGGLGRLQDGSWTVFDTRSGLPSNRVEAMLESQAPGGSRLLWVACYAGGLARLENGRFTVYGARSGLPTTRLRSLLETRASDGSRLLWVGTAAGGLARLAGGRWITFDTQTGLPNNIVRGFLETASDGGRRSMWLATAGGGIARFEDGRWQVFDTSSGLPSNFVHALAETRGPGNERLVWAGTDSAGLAQWSGGRWSPYADSHGLPSPAVQALWPTTNERGEPVLWAGTDSGLARLEGGRWTVHTTATGLPHDVVTTLRETETGDGRRVLWAGTAAGGLGRLEDGRWTRHDRRSGLANDNVRGLLETRTPSGARILWVGTLGGLSWTDSGAAAPRWQTLDDSTSPALPNNVVYQVREDARGRIYLFTNKGVARLTPQWRVPLESSAFSLETFGSQDGLPAEEFNSGASLVDSRGRVWAGSTAGAVMLDPSLDPSAHSAGRGAPAPLDVSSVVAGRTAPLAPGEALAHDGDVLFEYTLLSFFREPDTRYRTQLVGLENAPLPWTGDHSSRYGRLPQGSYAFRVWARDYAGTVSGPVEMSFSIRPAPWRTWWAYGLYAAALVGVGSGVLRLRLRALGRRNRDLQEQVRERTEELEQAVGWLHDAVKRAETLRAATEALSQSLDLPLVLQLILTELRKVVAYDSASVQELEGKSLRIIAGVGFPNLDEIVGLAFDVQDEGAPNGEVIRSRAPRIVADTESYPMFRTGPHQPAQIRSWMGVPLLRGERLIGIITLDKREPDFYTKDDSGLAAAFAAQAALSIENARLFDESQRHSAELEGHAAELEQAANALRDSEERTRAIVEKAHDAFIAMDRNGVITGWNAQAEAIFGWPRAEAIGNRVSDVIVPPRYREDHVRGLERFLATGEGPVLDKRLELKALHRDGREFPVELTISAVQFSSGPIFSAFIRDITERRRAESRLEAQHAATRVLAEATSLAEDAPRLLGAICESLGWVFGAFWQVDPEAKCLGCVATWHEPSAELPDFEALTRKTTFLRGTGLPGRIWQTGQPAWIPDVVRDANFPRAGLAAKEGLHGAFGFPVLSQGGVIGVLEFFSSEIEQPDPDLLAMMASVGSQLGQFIERKHAEQSVVKARHAAEDASRAKSAFVASMSHELRTPLNAILGFVQVMQRRQRDSEDEEHLAIISRSGEHLLGLINEVLSLSKIESGRMTLQETAFEIRELLESLRAMFQPRASSRGLAFEIRIQTDLPAAVIGDAVKLRQILINLLGNAFKFTQAGSVTLSASWREGRAVFEVADSGPGMSGQELASLFTAFTQAGAGLKAVEGTGLGLAISRNYARLMEGDVSASSEPGRGSLFRVELKLAEATEAAARAVTGRRVRGLAPGQRRRLLLVADDSMESRMALSRLLASAGFAVLEAVNGEEAVLVWRRDRPELIFMDVSMPVLDGLGATATIRAEERSQGLLRTPILAVTASAFDHEREAILKVGFDAFIAKPFREDEIFRLAAAPLGVEYVYDEAEPLRAGIAGTDGVILERLQNVPSDWLERFRDAMVQGDIAGALRLVGEIEEAEAPLAEELRARLKSYRLDELEAALKI